MKLLFLLMLFLSCVGYEQNFCYFDVYQKGVKVGVSCSYLCRRDIVVDEGVVYKNTGNICSTIPAWEITPIHYNNGEKQY